MASTAAVNGTGRALVVTVVGLAGAAWIATIGLHDRLHGGHAADALAQLPPAIRNAIQYCGADPQAPATAFAHWIGGWALMTVAMMLPPALPLMRAFDRLTAGRQNAAMLVALLAAAFLGIWLVAGVAIYGAGTLCNRALLALPLLADRPGLLAGAAAMLVGAYQFSPLKKACLDACRTPTGVIMTRWQSAHPARSALIIGRAYGAICVGCCWALMLLSVVAGAMALPIMVVAAILMMLERTVPAVRPLIPIQAAFAIMVGILLMTGAIPPAFFIG